MKRLTTDNPQGKYDSYVEQMVWLKEVLKG